MIEPPTLTRADVPAVWELFSRAVRMLVILRRAMAIDGSAGSSRGWRSSAEWRLTLGTLRRRFQE